MNTTNQTLTADKATVLNLYAESGVKGKAKIETMFGKKNLIGDIKEAIKTFEDALSYNGVTIEDFEKSIAFDTQDEIAYKKIKQIVLALNEGVNLKYDGSTYLYYPWFKVGSGVGFSYLGYDCDCSHSDVGSRLCFKSKELAVYAGKQFTALYEQYLNG